MQHEWKAQKGGLGWSEPGFQKMTGLLSEMNKIESSKKWKSQPDRCGVSAMPSHPFRS